MTTIRSTLQLECKTLMSPKRVPHLDLSYLSKCKHFLKFRKKKPALQNFSPLTGPCIEGSNRQILAKQVLLKTQVLVLAVL